MPVRKKGRVYNTQAWRRMCAAIKERDGFRCRLCGSPNDLTVQHRVPERLAPHLALAPGNLVTLCRPCHGREDGQRRYPL